MTLILLVLGLELLSYMQPNRAQTTVSTFMPCNWDWRDYTELLAVPSSCAQPAFDHDMQGHIPVEEPPRGHNADDAAAVLQPATGSSVIDVIHHPADEVHADLTYLLMGSQLSQNLPPTQMQHGDMSLGDG